VPWTTANRLPSGRVRNNPRIDRPWRDAVCKPELPGSLGRPDLVNKDKTPGSGVLLEPNDLNPAPTG
jgi:hypothetical protein